MENKDSKKDINRRIFLRSGLNTVAGLAVGGVTGIVAIRSEVENWVWQLDPNICVQCEKCLEKCPQNLPIPDLLNDVQEDMEGFLTQPLIWLGKRLMKVRKK